MWSSMLTRIMSSMRMGGSSRPAETKLSRINVTRTLVAAADQRTYGYAPAGAA
jgi:hypothetical protein